jgi:hypothetical protein
VYGGEWPIAIGCGEIVGVGAGVGTGVGSGVGAGVGSGVAAGVGEAVGVGAGDNVLLATTEAAGVSIGAAAWPVPQAISSRQAKSGAQV